MDRQHIAGTIRNVIAEQMDWAVPETLAESDRLNEDLNMDSIMVLQLAVYLEEAFFIEIPEEEVDPAVFGSVGSLIDFVIGLQAARPVGS